MRSADVDGEVVALWSPSPGGGFVSTMLESGEVDGSEDGEGNINLVGFGFFD